MTLRAAARSLPLPAAVKGAFTNSLPDDVGPRRGDPELSDGRAAVHGIPVVDRRPRAQRAGAPAPRRDRRTLRAAAALRGTGVAFAARPPASPCARDLGAVGQARPRRQARFPGPPRRGLRPGRRAPRARRADWRVATRRHRAARTPCGCGAAPAGAAPPPQPRAGRHRPVGADARGAVRWRRSTAGAQRPRHDFGHLFCSWFNRGFLVLRRIDWRPRPMCWRRSSATRRCTRSTAGTICAAGSSRPTGAASPSSTRSSSTSR